MYISEYYLESTIKSLDFFIKRLNIKGNINFKINKEKVIYYLKKIIKYIEDIELYFASCDIYYLTSSNDVNKIIDEIQNVEEEKDVNANKKIYDIVSEFMVSNLFLNERLIPSYINIDEDLRFKRRNRRNELNANKLNTLSSCIKCNRDILYFNPCCFSNAEDKMLKNMMDNIKMYCIVSEICTKEVENSTSFNESIYEKIIIENTENINNPSIKKNIKISNNVFDVLNISPEITINLVLRNNMHAYPTKEFTAIKDNLKFLRKEGILFYTIPYTRFTHEIALYISKNIKNINVIKYLNDNEKRITIIGQKDIVKDYQESYCMLKDLIYEDIPTNIGNYEYTLPETIKTIDLFRGGKINKKEITKIILEDNLYNDFFNEINNKKILTDTRPLLPFNVGQVGLILTSGRLDGVIEEPGNNKHIIKGRTIKYKETIENNTFDNDDIKPTEKISNIVQINAFDGDGNFVVIN